MKEIILKMKLGSKIISSKQKVDFGGACTGIPFFMKKRTLYTLIFTNTDYKKGIPVYWFYDIQKTKFDNTPDWWKEKLHRELTKKENKQLKEAMENVREMRIMKRITPIKCKDCRYKYLMINNIFGCYQYWNLFKETKGIKDLETIPQWCPLKLNLYKDALQKCNLKFKEVKE